MTTRDETGFAAGQATGTRLSARVARLAAQRLMVASRWWNRWRLRLMAGALVACADELEVGADEMGEEADGQEAARGATPPGTPTPLPVPGKIPA